MGSSLAFKQVRLTKKPPRLRLSLVEAIDELSVAVGAATVNMLTVA
jgi:hypothetical protein